MSVVAHSPTVVLYDQNKNPVGVLLDGTVYRLQVEAKIISSTASRTTIDSATADTLLLLDNPLRRGAVLYNDSSSQLRIGLGTTAVSSTDYTFLISAYTEWLVPFGYTGMVRGLWDVQEGLLRITELT